ncbi:hypothetical protein BC828DRAFT_413231 [Blastocladiella britannica]|nr:hypothetical protein BC828DRAFT_413231 [Blastocladiella britannica]
MAILAATVITKTGKVLVSRQFLETPPSRIEGLMSSFPKLVSTGTQHTTVDTDDVRFVYQPLDDLYLVLTTSKKSNILQDIASLHLFARVVADCCKSSTEREVVDKAFELIFAFDELVSFGYRENVSVQQLRTVLVMDSNEERIQEMIKKNKEMEAKEQSRLKAKQLDIQRKQMARAQAAAAANPYAAMSGGPAGPVAGGYGGQSGYGQQQQQQQQGGGMPGGYGAAPANPFASATGGSAPMPYVPSSITASPPRPQFPTTTGTGMKIGGAKPANQYADAFGGLATPVSATAPPVAASVTPTPVAAAASIAQPTEPVHVTLEERITCIVHRDGGLQTMEVKGKGSVQVTTAGAATARVQFDTSRAVAGGAQFKTHPNFDKKQWTESALLAPKDPAKAYPVGQPTPVMQWRQVTTDEAAVPLAVNCWPNPAGNGTAEVNIEYELLASHMTLRNVVIAVPIGAAGAAAPTVTNVDGETTFDRTRGVLYWQIAEISDANASGSLDFVAAGDQPGAFFPVAVQFSSGSLYCPVSVSGVSAADGSPVEFGVTAVSVPDEYKVI